MIRCFRSEKNLKQGAPFDDIDRKKLHPDVPVVPYGTDLYHWGEENIETPTIVR